MKPLPDMKRTGRIIINSYCGHVNFKGETTYGCHAEPGKHVEYRYKTGGCFSTVSLCPQCVAKLERGAK